MKNSTIFIFTSLASLSLCLVSCNTVAGVGKDLSAVGNTMTNTVDRTTTAINGRIQPQPQQQPTVIYAR